MMLRMLLSESMRHDNRLTFLLIYAALKAATFIITDVYSASYPTDVLQNNELLLLHKQHLLLLLSSSSLLLLQCLSQLFSPQLS